MNIRRWSASLRTEPQDRHRKSAGGTARTIAALLATTVSEPFAQQPAMAGGGSLPLAQDSATALSAEAQKQCDLGRAAKGRALRLAYFRASQALAERAVIADDQLANAHFALFCSLGEQMRIDGESLAAEALQFARSENRADLIPESQATFMELRSRSR